MADAVAGDVYVKKSGDTVNGTLAITGNFSAGTDSVEAPVTLHTHSNWRWDVGNGLGDVRVSDGVVGLSIGVASGGGGAGHVRFWPSGGSQLLTFGSPISGDQLTVDGNFNQVFSLSPFSVGTNTTKAPLTVQSADNWRWDVGSGYGDFYLGDGVRGLSIGVSSGGGGAGTVRLWPSGGVENVLLGNPTYGEVFEVHGDGSTVFRGQSYWLDSASNEWRIQADPNYSTITLYGPDLRSKVNLYGYAPYGQVLVRDTSGDIGVSLFGGEADGGQVGVSRDDGHQSGVLRGGSSALNQGGRLELFDGASLPSVNLHLDGDAAGDMSAIFPNDAIDALEILDEPGIVAGVRSLSLGLTSTVSDIVTVTITIPSSGYIVLLGTAELTTAGTTSFNDVGIQIDETAGGLLTAPYYSRFGLGGYVNTSANYIPLTVQRTYFKSAGTYTFRLEGNNTTSGGTATCNFAKLTAMYFATSYGSVATMASSGSDVSGARPVEVSDPSRTGDRTSTQYEVDLSVLELKAKEAKLAAIKAEKERIQAELELSDARRRQAQPFTQ
jgi:hypothetical protein